MAMGKEDETLAESLRSKIIEGDISPGEHLNEVAVSKKFNVSRNTLREAFRILEEQGLLVRIPNRGVSVTSPSTTTVIDLYRMRRIIQCGALAGGLAEHPAVARMQHAVNQARECVAANDWHGVGSCNMHYHGAIVALADSPRLSRAYVRAAAELRLVFLKIDNPQLLHGPFVERNQDIIDILKNEGGPAAAAEFESYLDDAERLLLAAYTRLNIA